MDSKGYDSDALTLHDVVEALDALYPQSTAMDWDRVGTVAGNPAQPVRRILFAVDPTLAVIEEARERGADLIVTHHPLLLRGIHSVATTSAKGASVTNLVRHGIALHVCHTNADVADPGVCDAMATAFGLTNVGPLVPQGSSAETSSGPVLGRVGELVAEESLREFAERVRGALPATAGGIRVAGPPEAPVRRVAVVGGSGDGMFDVVRASGADVYVTADLRHHPVLEAREEDGPGGPYLVDGGHWATESLWLASGRDRLTPELTRRHGEAGAAVEIELSGLRTEPWSFVVGANDAGDLA